MIFNKNNNGTQEISALATWTADHEYEHISQALILAKKKVLTIIDPGTYAIALSHYLSEEYKQETPTEESKLKDELVLLFQTVMVNFAYEINMQKDVVIWDNSGINITWSEQFRPAQQGTLEKVSSSLKKDGYQFLDLLIELLENNAETFSSFKTSVEGKKLSELFINDADEFSYFFNIDRSVSYFFEIADVIRRVQRTEIANAIRPEFFQKMVAYQEKRIELEKVTQTAAIVGDLPPAVTDGTLCRVTENATYYIYDKTDWKEYCYDASALLEIIKPAVVDLVMYNKYYSDFSNLNSDTKQIEIIRANANILLQKANATLAGAIRFVEASIYQDTPMDTGNESYFNTDHSFSL